jgi:hypothetical protein
VWGKKQIKRDQAQVPTWNIRWLDLISAVVASSVPLVVGQRGQGQLMGMAAKKLILIYPKGVYFWRHSMAFQKFFDA